MKKIYLLAVSAFFLASCNSNQNEKSAAVTETEEVAEVQHYGEMISMDHAIAASDLFSTMGEQDSLNLKLEGVVKEVCQKKGCWMKIDVGNEKTVRVTFKDYGFFMPFDIAGKTVVLDGYAKREVTDVATLRHFAEDAGKSAEEIEAITEPKDEVTFLAHGVILK
jgi:hypothetical protein